MTPEETYVRRVCAVLLADVSGFSAMMGEDDEGTARAVRRLNVLVQGIVADASGRAEATAGDAIFATFDSVVAAVDAAIQIQRRLVTEELAARPLRVRIGVHVGDVLLHEGGAFGDAINIGARLQALARPGTICVSDAVYRQVRTKFDTRFEDLGQQRLKNISDPVHAYLIVPEGTGGRLIRRAGAPARIAAGAVAAVALLAGLLAYGRFVTTQPDDRAPAIRTAAEGTARDAAAGPQAERAAAKHGPVALGVMLFKSHGGDDESGWMREALREGLNARLSQLASVKVYSKEFIDFLITRKKLTEFEVATQLGITKMLSGSFVVVGRSLRIETHVVDVGTGVIDASYTTEGETDGFFDLQNRLVLGVVERLDLPVSADEERELLARPAEDVDALKRLLEAEGATPSPALAPLAPGPDRRSGLLRSLAFDSLISARPAHAQEADDPEVEVRAMLERWRRAAEGKKIESLAEVYLNLTEDQQAAQQRYFENVRDLRISIENVDIAVVGDEAVVSYTRTDDFADVGTGQPMHVSVRLTKTLRRDDGAWKIAPDD